MHESFILMGSGFGPCGLCDIYDLLLSLISEAVCAFVLAVLDRYRYLQNRCIYFNSTMYEYNDFFFFFFGKARIEVLQVTIFIHFIRICTFDDIFIYIYHRVCQRQ